ncbi:MAG: bifunctional 4'-phosphopantothenoylcysteine decarboxylase/phosphopantothenoylcysteine synthetase, partial [Pseudomonadota bacterium]|nr:bifunctional 4'-phosphopantothenoylcysteine decarboxylase/phosphopantothenoylcysteine synthetase [Pseudomonadota bacterium]
ELHARGKLQRKRLDMIAANQVGIAGSGFESDDNVLTVYWPDGERQLGPASKLHVANGLLDLITEHLRR